MKYFVAAFFFVSCFLKNRIGIKTAKKSDSLKTRIFPFCVFDLILSFEVENMFLIRKATLNDLSRVAEIFVFNNRINYFPIFEDEKYSFGELQVISVIENYFGKAETDFWLSKRMFGRFRSMKSKAFTSPKRKNLRREQRSISYG